MKIQDNKKEEDENRREKQEESINKFAIFWKHTDSQYP